MVSLRPSLIVLSWWWQLLKKVTISSVVIWAGWYKVSNLFAGKYYDLIFWLLLPQSFGGSINEVILSVNESGDSLPSERLWEEEVGVFVDFGEWVVLGGSSEIFEVRGSMSISLDVLPRTYSWRNAWHGYYLDDWFRGGCRNVHSLHLHPEQIIVHGSRQRPLRSC